MCWRQTVSKIGQLVLGLLCYSLTATAQTVTTAISDRLSEMVGACPAQWEDVQVTIDPAVVDVWAANTIDRDAFKAYLQATVVPVPDAASLEAMASDNELIATKCTEERVQFLEAIYTWRIGNVRKTVITNALDPGWIKLEGQTIGPVGSTAGYYGADLFELYEIAKQWPPNTGNESWTAGDVVLLPDGEQFIWREEIKYTDKVTQALGIVPVSPGTTSYTAVDSCKALKVAQPTIPDGIYWVRIYPSPVQVYCDMTTDGGGWTVFQNRVSDSIDFYRTWVEYKNGFGDLNSNFWLGNDSIHLLTQTPQELYVHLEAPTGATAFAKYSSFSISDEATNYTLTVSGFSGDAGDSLAVHTGRQFSTKDRDNDTWPGSCATNYQGAWWFTSCHYSHLNGVFGSTAYAAGPVWFHWLGFYEPLKTRMMFRSVP